MEYKDIMAEVKALDQKGEGILRFIRFNQEDKHSDITLPGFIGKQEAILIANHNWKSDHPPLGRGESFEADGSANFVFKLNMDDPRAKNWYSWLKMDQQSGRPLQQISYGFSLFTDGQARGQKDGKSVRFLKPRPDGSPGATLHELSFVTAGAGTDQGLLNIKQADEHSEKESRGVEPELSLIIPAASSSLWRIVSVHHTGLDDSPFESTRQYKRIQASQAAGLYRSAFAVQWPGTSPDMKESWGLLHHVIDDDGKPGAASLHACLTGMSLLKGWDGVFIPEPIREELHAHYAAHLRDGGYEVPDLLQRDSGVELKHELRFWLWLAKSVMDRRARVQEFLIRIGKEESKELAGEFDQLFRYVTHMQGVAGSTGEAMQHMEDEKELSERAAEIARTLAAEDLVEEEAKQADLRAMFERFRAIHG